jgi:hypothetical protein
MNQLMKRLAVGSLAFFSLAFLLPEIFTDESRLGDELLRLVHASPSFEGGLVGGPTASRLDGGLVDPDREWRTIAGSKRGSHVGAQSKRKFSFTSDLFRNNCARCHGADGRADTPLGRTYQTPDLTDPEWWRKNSKITSTASLISIVSRGRGGMPAFGKKLKRTEIRLLVGYARKFKNSGSTNR